MLPLGASAVLETMIMKGYSAIAINGASPSDYLVSYAGYSLGVSYFAAEKQSVYPTAPAHGANITKKNIIFSICIKILA